jgi:hypothetical protein
MVEDTGSGARQQQILLKYFTPEQVKRFEVADDTGTVRQGDVSVDRQAGARQGSAATDDEFVNGQLT